MRTQSQDSNKLGVVGATWETVHSHKAESNVPSKHGYDHRIARVLSFIHFSNIISSLLKYELWITRQGRKLHRDVLTFLAQEVSLVGISDVCF